MVVFIAQAAGGAIPLAVIATLLALGTKKWDSIVAKPILMCMAATVISTFLNGMGRGEGGLAERVFNGLFGYPIALPLASATLVAIVWVAINLARKRKNSV